jgi:hypothetical protein
MEVFWLLSNFFCLYCLVGFSIMTYNDYNRDCENKQKEKAFLTLLNAATTVSDKEKVKKDHFYVYSPTITYRMILSRFILSIIPVANMLAAVMFVTPSLFRKAYSRLKVLLNTPLVIKS